MKTGRYIQGPSSNSFLQMSHKYTPTNRHSSAPKNPENLNQSMKLPILPTNKSMVSTHTDRNTKNKLYLLSEKVEELRSEVHNTRMDSNETMNHIRYLKEELVDNQLKRDSDDMKKKVNGLQKLLNITKATHEERSNNLRQNYIKLWNQTQQLKQLTFDLRMRIDKLDDTMGMKNI